MLEYFLLKKFSLVWKPSILGKERNMNVESSLSTCKVLWTYYESLTLKNVKSCLLHILAANTAATSQPPSRFKYINPQILVPNVPPPGYSGKSSKIGEQNSWKSQVDDFLYKPRTRSCSPVTSRSSSSRGKRTISPISAKKSSTPVKKKSKFTPKAQIAPPSPGKAWRLPKMII